MLLPSTSNSIFLKALFLLFALILVVGVTDVDIVVQ